VHGFFTLDICPPPKNVHLIYTTIFQSKKKEEEEKRDYLNYKEFIHA
jgi:hypothetical protein